MKHNSLALIRTLMLAGLLVAMTSAALKAATVESQRDRAATPAVDSNGLYTWDRPSTAGQTLSNTVFLPMTANNFCRDFLDVYFDDFSDPGSGWFTGEDDYVRSEYLNGEFRIYTKRTGYFYLYRARTCPRDDYSLEVDARWVGGPGSSYGLIFGLADDYSSYYLFDMNSDYQMYRLLRRDAQGFSIVLPISESSAINGGNGVNQLKIIRQGNRIALAINGSILFDQYNFPSSGRKEVGLVSSPYDGRPNSDARFDNFRLTPLAPTSMAREPSRRPESQRIPGDSQASFADLPDALPAWDEAGR